MVSILLIYTGLKKQPGLGIIGAVIIIVLHLMIRDVSLAEIGFQFPENWLRTIGFGLGLGLINQLLSVVLIEPLSEKITGSKHDHSVIGSVKGNWKAFFQWMIMVWILMAVIEEGIYRGYLMTEIRNLLGVGILAMSINLVFSALYLVFLMGNKVPVACSVPAPSVQF